MHLFHFLWPICALIHHNRLANAYKKPEQKSVVFLKLLIYAGYYAALLCVFKFKGQTYNSAIIFTNMILPVISIVYTVLYFFTNKCFCGGRIGDNRQEVA